MLSRISIESARALADVLDQQGRVLVPVEDTPVDALVEQTEPVEPIGSTVEEAMETLATVTVTAVPGLTAETHDDAMQDTVQPVIELINRRLCLARRVINPLINEYDRLMLADIQGLLPMTPKIEAVEYDTYYSTPSVQNLFNGYNVSSDETAAGFRIPEFNYKDYIYTGSRTIDNKINEIIEQYGEGHVEQVLNEYFQNKREFIQLPIRMAKASTDEIAYQFLAHFVLRKLYNQGEVIPGEGLENEQNLHLMKALAITSTNIRNYVSTNNNWVEKGILFADPAEDSVNTIRVYAPSYNKYQEAQGNDVSVFGAYVSDKPYTVTYQQVLDRKDEYSDLHDKTVHRRNLELSVERNNKIRAAALRHLGEIILQIPEDVVLSLPFDRGENTLDAVQRILVQRGKDYIENPATPIGDDLWSYASDILCAGVLTELELKSFFDTMEKYLRPAEGVAELDAKEAAYYAVLNEVVTYFLSQTSMDAAK